MKKQKTEYAADVKEINEKRLTEQPIPIVEMFTKVSESVTCTNSQKTSMNAAWDIVSQLTCEKSNRIYGAYMDEKQDKYQILTMQQRLIKSARVYLESQYVVVMETFYICVHD